MKLLTRILIVAIPAALAIAMPREVMAFTIWANEVGSDYTVEALLGLAVIGGAVVLDTILWPFLTRE